MKVKRFTINPDDVKAGRQEGSPFIRINREVGRCWVSISDGEIGLTAYLTGSELDNFRDDEYEIKG